MEKGKVVSIEDRIPKLKQLRKKKANKRLIFLLSLFFILVACVLYFLSPLSHMKSVKVTGNQYISSKQIIKLSDLKAEQSIWKIDSSKVSDKIESFPEIASADVSPIFPNSVKITVKEHKRIAYLSKGSSFYPILDNGEILGKLDKGEIPVFAPVLIDFKEGKALNLLLEQLDKLPVEIQNSISEIHYTPTKTDGYHITMYMNDGYEVSATSRTLSDKMVHYPAIISQLDPRVKGVIDLEVGSYFKAYQSPEKKQKSDEGQ
ncbi:cell division protein FtsQ/DivIB [Bacillus massiliglaciei]|uniref:cell division protein FtsQ/DivIB n=1 Tax=Bacillus massiliglaciei TaxID=1816693 RepID=UPI000A98CCC2|nr:cell division protein FtsQ/DivIB [Bacillus massiliglaciei]